ncbi:Hypothetical protein, predicted transmembrane protein [Mycoplasma yeatsii 13926]|uniref:Transmembrane protein n=1 Tax=Mycoplasma yeatsii 13926 TaxID=1188240 RepID=S6G420_9MOLU|nr:hypothetical protein [Mycoplasma yeatsii]EOA07497.1 Hypothetical protein, predicted transmembrane protein [Mycoplasma yeatsii 13926]
MNNDIILDPVQEFESYLHKNEQIIEKYFQEFTEQSEINIEKNRSQVKKINEAKHKLDRANTVLKRVKIWSIINIIVIVLSTLLFAFFIWALTSSQDMKNNEKPTAIICTVISGIVATGFLLTQVLWTRKKRKEIDSIVDKADKTFKKELKKGYDQTSDLIILIDYGTKEKIFSETMPLIKFKRFLTQQGLDNFKKKYKPIDYYYDKELSCTALKSGSVYNNPFILSSSSKFAIESKEYVGTLTISWQETQGDKTVTKTQTLVASVVKPIPVRYDSSYLTFGIELAPNLNFTRTGAGLNQCSQKQKEKYAKKIEKSLYKYAEKNLNFSPLTNTKFEAYFGAFDRNDDREFRLLFTPLAQENLVRLIEDNKASFGDNFDMIKQNKSLSITSNELIEFEINDTYPMIESYSYDEIKEYFFETNKWYFINMYSIFAPYFAMPTLNNIDVDSQDKKESSKVVLSKPEIEAQLSMLDNSLFRHKDTKTDSLLYVKSFDPDTQIAHVESKGYDIVERVDFVPVWGRDGNLHNVPVPWEEYIECTAFGNLKITPFKEFSIDEDWYENVGSKLNKNQITTDLAIVEFVD